MEDVEACSLVEQSAQLLDLFAVQLELLLHDLNLLLVYCIHDVDKRGAELQRALAAISPAQFVNAMSGLRLLGVCVFGRRFASASLAGASSAVFASLLSALSLSAAGFSARGLKIGCFGALRDRSASELAARSSQHGVFAPDFDVRKCAAAAATRCDVLWLDLLPSPQLLSNMNLRQSANLWEDSSGARGLRNHDVNRLIGAGEIARVCCQMLLRERELPLQFLHLAQLRTSRHRVRQQIVCAAGETEHGSAEHA